MGLLVTTGAALACTFGLAPSSLIALPLGTPVAAGVMTAATIVTNIPIANIPPFGMCNAPTNPTVIAATAAALGTPTPGACVPVIPAPWTPGSPTVLINGKPALNNASVCNCAYLGVISVTSPGQTKVMVP